MSSFRGELVELDEEVSLSGVKLARDVPEPVKRALWGRAAGRCQFDGCNKPLWRSPLTSEEVNIADQAHIWSFSRRGPRGNEGVSSDELNTHANLILVCHECHRKIDKEKDGGRYTADLLQGWKAQHEARVELVSGIIPDKRSHVLRYGASIGDHASPLHFEKTAPVLFPERYPADDKGIELGMINTAGRDRDPDFYRVEANNLVRLFGPRVRDRLADGTIGHLSIFGLGPQPLLILLGSLLTDIPEAETYQLHREPPGWAWPGRDEDWELHVDEPEACSGPPALILALSATVVPDRALAIDPAFRVWTIRVDNPHNDVLRTRRQLRTLRRCMRLTLDRIKARHGEDALLAIFPVVPVAAAVELGRVWMPKADLRLRLFDEIKEQGGFVHALDVPYVLPSGRAA